MRWTERAPALPLQPLDALAARAPAAHAQLAELAPEAGIVIAVEAAAAAEVLRHLASHPDEQGGLLLGEVYAEGADPAGSRAVRVTQAVAATDFASTGVSLRMASGVWETARARLGPAELVVGWYHSHPGLGAFFSHTDRKTQRAFFPHAYSLGWVVDPRGGESAWFVGPESRPPARVLYGVEAGAVAGGAVGAGTPGDAYGAADGCRNGGGPTTSTRVTK
jgi:proteasome lid subunit RPN8/RPN11